MCLHCRRTFSRQSFSVTYYCKRPELLRGVATGLVAGSALRQIARSLGCAPNTAAAIGARLGRHAMLLQARALKHLRGSLDETVVLDHFETFEFTQDYPFGVATAVGSRSWFVYVIDPAPHRRSGRRSPAQERRLRTRPRRATRGRYAGSTRRILDLLLRVASQRRVLTIDADAHPEYLGAVRRHPERRRIRLRRFPSPPRQHRGRPRSAAAGALFACDLFHKLLRHSMAHHRRETIAFARRINAAMERLFLVTSWRNFVKRRSERRTRSPTPAMRLGLARAPWSWKRLLSQRLFPEREQLPETWIQLYRREWTTPLVGRSTRHELERAF
jgi:hypothetical protein